MESNAMSSFSKSIYKIINRLVDYKMEKITSIKSARVVNVNRDETVDIIIPPNTTVYHNILNQSIYKLHPGDNVKIIKEDNNLSNMWIIGGFNLNELRYINPYPVGAYFSSSSQINPSEYFGGNWIQVEQSKFGNNQEYPCIIWQRIK